MESPYLHSWPASGLEEAIELLARRHGLRQAAPLGAIATTLDPARAGDRIAAVAEGLGFEAEAVDTRYDEVEPMLRAAAPAVVRLEQDGAVRFLALLRGGARHVTVIGPDRAVHRLPLAEVRAALCSPLEQPAIAAAEQLLAAAGLSARPRARTALLQKQLGSRSVGGLWLFRMPPAAPFFLQLRRAGILRGLWGLIAAHAAQYTLWMLCWYVAGLSALRGSYDGGWILAWVLLLATIVPLRLLVLHRQGVIAIRTSTLLKRRLLAGALELELDQVRTQGVGQLLGRVLESDAVGSLAAGGGVHGLTALVELVGAGMILMLGAGAGLHAGALLAGTTLAGLLAWQYYRQQSRWAASRLEMTHQLVEQMIGHRTRLAQQPRIGWHAAEDRGTEQYLEASRRMDTAAARLVALVPRGWLVVGIAVLGQAFVVGTSPAALAVGLGGVLLAYQALRRLVIGLTQLTGAAVAWQQIALLFHAAARAPADGPSAAGAVVQPPGPAARGETLLEAHGLQFGYEGSGRTVIENASLHIRSGDRLLLEGPSGGGKSTLAALLAGLRRPHAGLLLFKGLDSQTLGLRAWRGQVASAPQFHENHVLTGTFAFNLLLGRRWPAAPHDLEQAEQLCRALGLGPLLDCMPAGLHQMVGETGWQLSHGEKSRLFLARALLQDADLVILDESFGALDPENLARSLRCVLERTPTLMLIAHR